MFHLSERTLEKLVAGSAPVSEVERIRQHVRDCRGCARRLEEWRDAYSEIDSAYPELAYTDTATRFTDSGLVIVPAEERKWTLAFPRVNFANALWVVALLMALLVGYGANRLRSEGEGFEASNSSRPPRRMPRPETGNGAGVPMPLAAATDSLVRVAPPSPPPQPSRVAPDSDSERPRQAASQSLPRSESVRPPRSTPAPTIDTPAEPPPPVPASPSFRNTASSEAARRLGGPIRMLRGLEFDHIEVGPAAAVPGALPGLAVVRVVYRTPTGGRMLLDQQLIKPDSSGFRPLEDASLENGQTAFGTAPNGVSVATWLDQHGYRLSLVAQAPLDSMKQLVGLVE
jgi:hypothetical protein